MTRTGRRNRAYFRLGAYDARRPRDGRCLEELGHYDPQADSDEKKLVLKPERIKHWLSVGAQPSEKVAVFLKARGIIGPNGKPTAAGAPAPAAAAEKA
jgi:small subunit ribosomal protein S16